MIAQYFDIIVLLVVVVLVFQKLKSLLGTRPETKISDENAAKIFDIILKEAEKSANSEKNENNVTQITEDPEKLSETDKVLRRIPGFNKEKFLNGAKRAFEAIISAFSKGDAGTLEMLVSKNLYKKFQEIIEKRQAEGIVAENDFIGFDKAEIINAKISKDDCAKIVVEFVSQQVNLLKNAKEEVIEGDENFIQTISDTWTFEKSLTSANPNWLLVSTKK